MLFPKTPSHVDVQMQFHKLLRFLNDRVVEIDYIVHITSLYLTRRELVSRKFLRLCERLLIKGYLGPDNHEILKQCFPTYDDNIAFRKICETEKAIICKQVHPVDIILFYLEQFPYILHLISKQTILVKHLFFLEDNTHSTFIITCQVFCFILEI